jgi:pimeloyl-ACP methyl ester carboxylesterase
MFDAFESFNYNIRTSGEGKPLLFVGGMTSASSDFDGLRDSLPAEHTYPGNPWYEGQEKWEHNVDTHDSKHGEGLAGLMAEFNTTKVVAHSRGALHTLLASDSLRSAGLQEPSMVFIAPPLKKPTFSQAMRLPNSRREHVGLILDQHVKGIPAERVERMIDDHTREYGEQMFRISKDHGSRVISRLPDFEKIRPLIHALKKSALIISSEGDEFFDKDGLRQILAMSPRLQSVVLPTRSHYPHIEAPELVAEAIEKSGIFEK